MRPPQPRPRTATAPPAAPAGPSEKILDTSFEYQISSYYCGPAAVHNALTAGGIDAGPETRHRRQPAVRLRLMVDTASVDA
ncbi:hypothetical protein GCM10027452_14060 [Micromonospora halotolerans]